MFTCFAVTSPLGPHCSMMPMLPGVVRDAQLTRIEQASQLRSVAKYESATGAECKSDRVSRKHTYFLLNGKFDWAGVRRGAGRHMQQ